MFSKKSIILLLAFYGALNAIAQETCEKCLTNGAYCVDETHFYLCNGDLPLTSAAPHECEAGTFCTNSPDICAVENQQANIVKGCGGSSNCNNCGNRLFTCVSKTEFASCRTGQPTDISSCDDGQVCSVALFDDPNTKKLCAPEAVLEYLGFSVTCSNTQASSTPPPTASTPSSDSLKQQCEAAEANAGNRFFYIRNKEDSTCRTYIYCERINNQMVHVLFTCKTGYYDATTRKCVATKPKDCTATVF